MPTAINTATTKPSGWTYNFKRKRGVWFIHKNDVVVKDIKGEGYEGRKTFLYANNILEKEKKHMPLL